MKNNLPAPKQSEMLITRHFSVGQRGRGKERERLYWMIVVCVCLLDRSFSGIGGFMVRQRSRPGQGQGKAKRSLCRKDSSGSVSENPTGKDDGQGSHQLIHLFIIADFCLNIIFVFFCVCCADTVHYLSCSFGTYFCLEKTIFHGKILTVFFIFLIPTAGWGEVLPDTPVDETPPGPEVPEKIKKRYRKKKTKLEEEFPAYLQVCHLDPLHYTVPPRASDNNCLHI